MGRNFPKKGSKAAHREHLIQYLADPENEWLSKEGLSLTVLGMKAKNFVSKTWTPEAFQREIAEPALTLRRERYVQDLAEIDRALLEKAKEGDIRAIKLAYQRFEAWKEGSVVIEQPLQSLSDKELQERWEKLLKDEELLQQAREYEEKLGGVYAW